MQLLVASVLPPKCAARLARSGHHVKDEVELAHEVADALGRFVLPFVVVTWLHVR
jgi:hypothetical protein